MNIDQGINPSIVLIMQLFKNLYFKHRISEFLQIWAERSRNHSSSVNFLYSSTNALSVFLAIDPKKTFEPLPPRVFGYAHR